MNNKGVLESKQVALLIADSPNVAELTNRLAKEGIHFRSRRSLRRFLVRSWKRAHEAEMKQLLAKPIPVSTELQPIEVLSDGVHFKIYGAAHGQRRVARMGLKVREELRTMLMSAESLPQSDYATERGFARLLGLPRSKELDYTEEVFRRVGVRRMLGMVLRVAVALPLFALIGPLLALSRDPVTREIRSALQDPVHLSRIAQIWKVSRLPARIRMELVGSSFGIIHSQEMARSTLALARDNGLESLTVLVGLAHSDEIAHFLQLELEQ
jgi:hypothetical protein